MAQDNQSTVPENLAQTGSALRRKVATGRAEHQARAMSLAKALRLTVGKVADGLFDLAMATISLRDTTVGGDDLDSAIMQEGLLILLDGLQGRRAAAVLDAALVGALVQQQTMGQVLANAEGDQRALTTTDAAMCAPFLDGLLQGIEGVPEDPADLRMINGYRFGARADDMRQLKLALIAAQYRVVHLGLDIAAGARQGQMALCFPVPEEEAAAAPDPEASVGACAERVANRSDKRRLGDAVLGLHADLLVALTQLKVPVHRLGRLKPGDVLELRTCNFEKVEILTRDGRQIGGGALGQIDGTRAVQITHQNRAQQSPKRRASDREDLDLPDVTQKALHPPEHLSEDSGEGIIGDLAALPEQVDALRTPEPTAPPNAAEAEPLPDMSDLPDIDETALAYAG